MRVINFLFAKNRKSHSGLTKTVGVLLLCVTLISTWSFPQKAEAAQSTFNDGITVQLPDPSQTNIYADGAIINGTIVVDDPAIDINGDGQIESSNTDELQSWANVYIANNLVQEDGFMTIETFGLMIKTDDTTVIIDGTVSDIAPKTSQATNTFSKTVTGLSPNTTYWARIIAPKGDDPSVFFVSGAITFKTKNDGSTVASAVPQENATSQGPQKIPGDVPPCGFGDGVITKSESSMMGCLAVIIYYGLYYTSSKLAMLGGFFLDFFMGYSISSDAYTTSSFPEKGWGMLRDLANICFIFLLVYAGIRLILGIGKFNAKSTIVNVILMAILINFSLFFTKLIIDAGNITARIFYNALEVQNKADGTPNVGIAGEKAISVTLIDQVDPQKIMSSVGEDSSSIETDDGSAPDKNEYAGYFILVSLAVTAVNLYFMFVFFSVGFLFVGRVIQLWVSMITAPIACISYAAGAGFHDGWWKDLWKSAFVAPIFLFFLYLIASFLKAGLVTGLFSNYNDKGFVSILMAVAVPLFLLVGLMKKAQDAAMSFSSEIATKAAGALNTAGKVAGGLAIGAATGGASLAMSRTVGAGAKALQSSGVQKALRSREAKGGISGKFAKFTANTIDKGSKASFDIRNTGIGGSLLKKTGLNTDNKMLNYVGLNTDARKGGYDQLVKDKDKKKQERVKNSAKSFESSFKTDDDVKAYYEKKHKDFITARDVREKEAWMRATGKTKDDWVATDKTTKDYLDTYRTTAEEGARFGLGLKENPKLHKTKREASADFKKQYAKSIKDKSNLSADPRTWTFGKNPLTQSIDPAERASNKSAAEKIEKGADKELEAENRFTEKKNKLKAKEVLENEKKDKPDKFKEDMDTLAQTANDLDVEVKAINKPLSDIVKEIRDVRNALKVDASNFKVTYKTKPDGTVEEDAYGEPVIEKVHYDTDAAGNPTRLSPETIKLNDAARVDFQNKITDLEAKRKPLSEEQAKKMKLSYENKQKVQEMRNIDQDAERLRNEIKAEEDRRKEADEKK
jgi:hypothetical protein